MISFLNWQSGNGIAITDQQHIAYKDEQGNVTALPPIQVVVAVESYSDNVFYPVCAALDSTGKIIWRTSYREHDNFDSAFKYAKRQIDETFLGSFEDGVLRHDALNGLAYEILKIGQNSLLTNH